MILKFFLNVSRKEQKNRFMERLDKPKKNWKFSASDVHERKFWPEYMDAFEEAIRATASKHAPWYIVPADNKWFTRLFVAAAIVAAVEELSLSFPKIDDKMKKELAAARADLPASRKAFGIAVSHRKSLRASGRRFKIGCPDVDNDFHSRRRWSVSARHDGHDRRL